MTILYHVNTSVKGYIYFNINQGLHTFFENEERCPVKMFGNHCCKAIADHASF
jgi:hypothetical protein